MKKTNKQIHKNTKKTPTDHAHTPNQQAKTTHKKAVSRKKTSAPIKPDIFDKYLNGKWGLALVVGLMLIIGFVAFKDYLFLKYLYYFKDIGSDSLNVDYPSIRMGQYMAEEPGFLKTWTFYMGLGFNYFSGIPNPLHPTSYFSFLITPVINFFAGDDYIFNRFHHTFGLIILSGIFFYFYLRTLNLSGFTQIVGSLLYTFLGFTIMGATWGHHYEEVLPFAFLLLSLEQFIRKNRWYFIPLAVFFFGNNIYYLYLYGAFAFIYSTFRMIDEYGFDIKKIGLSFVKLGSLGVLGVAMNFVNTYPGFKMILEAPRATGESTNFAALSSGVVTDHTFERVTAILRSFSTDMLGNGKYYFGWSNYLEAPLFYCGLITLLLVPQVFPHLDKKKKPLYVAFFIIWLLVAFVPFIRHALLLFAGDYYKRGINMFVILSWMFMGLHALYYIDKRAKINFYILIPTVILLFGLLFYRYNIPNVPAGYEGIDKGLQKAVAIFLGIYTGLIIMLHFPSIKNISKILILLTIVIELTYFSGITQNKRLLGSNN